MKSIKNILYKTLDNALAPDYPDYDERKKAAIAFSLAVFDGRMGVGEVEKYRYMGRHNNRDLFLNTLTGLYLD